MNTVYNQAIYCNWIHESNLTKNTSLKPIPQQPHGLHLLVQSGRKKVSLWPSKVLDIASKGKGENSYADKQKSTEQLDFSGNGIS